jgi:hypothetical protein
MNLVGVIGGRMSGCPLFLQRTSLLLSSSSPPFSSTNPGADHKSPSRIGDYAPERPLFQILIAITSGPRFLLILLGWLVSRQRREDLSGKKSDNPADEVRNGKGMKNGRGKRGSSRADWVALVGVARTFTWYVPFPHLFSYLPLTSIVVADGSTSLQQIITVSPPLLFSLPPFQEVREKKAN